MKKNGATHYLHTQESLSGRERKDNLRDFRIRGHCRLMLLIKKGTAGNVAHPRSKNKTGKREDGRAQMGMQSRETERGVVAINSSGMKMIYQGNWCHQLPHRVRKKARVCR